MTKKLRFLSVVFLCVAMMASSVISYFAETYYIYDGYKYRDIDSTSICFSGWEGDTDTFVLPEKIGHRYVAAIDSYAFKNNTNIKSIDLTQATYLREIGTGAFMSCKALETMVIPSWVTNLSESMFLNCSSLESLNVQMNATCIPDEMCNYCSSLATFDVPDSVTEICRYAFANCTSLSYVRIPSEVQSIAASSFYNCPNLTLGVYYGSYAQQYAIDHNINYTLLDGVLLGDVDGKDGVKINDVTMIQSYLAELTTLEGIYLHAADANQDGIVDISDATAIQMYIAEYELPYPIGQYFTKEVVTQENN